MNGNNSGSKSKIKFHVSFAELEMEYFGLVNFYQFTGGYSNNNSTNEAWETEQTFYIAETYRGYDFNSVSPNSKVWSSAPHSEAVFTNNAQQYSYNIQNNCNSVKTFNNENRINALVGMELRSSTNKGVSNTVWGYAPDRG